MDVVTHVDAVFSPLWSWGSWAAPTRWRPSLREVTEEDEQRRMVILSGLITFLDDFMGHVGDKDPHMPNGVQVRGREESRRLATGVSASARAGKGTALVP
jgi:hypothetical protein